MIRPASIVLGAVAVLALVGAPVACSSGNAPAHAHAQTVTPTVRVLGEVHAQIAADTVVGVVGSYHGCAGESDGTSWVLDAPGNAGVMEGKTGLPAPSVDLDDSACTLRIDGINTGSIGYTSTNQPTALVFTGPSARPNTYLANAVGFDDPSRSNTLSFYANGQSTVTNGSTGLALTLMVGDDPDVGTSSTTATLFDPPTTPANVHAAAGNGIALVWFGPSTTGDGGAPAGLHYEVATNPPTQYTGEASSPMVIAGLTNGTAYTFTVTAVSDNGSSPASAATTAATPSASIAGGTWQAQFAYTGAAQSWIVPPTVTSLSVDMAGGAGGNQTYNDGLGGLGGRVVATLSATPGALLQVNVGGVGEADPNCGPCAGGGGGWNGGGGPHSSDDNGWAGGGGATDVRSGVFALANRILVAGGGGGAGNEDLNGGAGGGLTGGAGQWPNTGPMSALAGQGGSQTAGGAAGCWWSGTGCGGAGSLGQGGNYGDSGGSDGAGGGGGYYGGGGSTNYAGGGGGSSYTDPVLATNVTHTQGYRAGNGYATLAFDY